MTAAGPQSPSCLSPWSRKKSWAGGVTSQFISRLSVITHSGIAASSSCSVPADLSIALISLEGDRVCISGGVLGPVSDRAECCASCSTRSTISVAALSACSSASVRCKLRLRLIVPIAAVTVHDWWPQCQLPEWVSDPLIDLPVCRSLAPCAYGVSFAPAIGAYPVG